MNNDELRRWLKHAADLLETFAKDAGPNEGLRNYASGQSEADYVDMASGQIGVSGGVRQVDVGAQMKRRDAVVREVAEIRRFLSSAGSCTKVKILLPPKRSRCGIFPTPT